MLLRLIQTAKQLGIGFFVLILITSCTSFSGTDNSSATVSDSSGTESESPDPESPERPPVIELAGRIDFNEKLFRNLLITTPIDGSPVFFVAVPRMAERENEYRMGLMLLARQAAIHKQVSVTAKFMTQSNNRDMGYREQVDVEVDKELVQSMLDKVEITSYYRDVEGSYFNGVLKGEALPNFQVPAGVKHAVPEWFTNLPSYEGYITAVGTAQRRMFIAESFMQSDRQAMAALAKQRDVEVKQKRDDIEVEYRGSAYQQLNLEITDTIVKGFYVIDRWVSNDGNTYYSLAVCPK
ncbi:MAG: LPP20 family lipoprotein [Spirochaetota bacterium]